MYVEEENERRTKVDGHSWEDERLPATSVRCSSCGAASAMAPTVTAVFMQKLSIERARRAGRWTRALARRTRSLGTHGPLMMSSSSGRTVPACEHVCTVEARCQLSKKEAKSEGEAHLNRVEQLVEGPGADLAAERERVQLRQLVDARPHMWAERRVGRERERAQDATPADEVRLRAGREGELQPTPLGADQRERERADSRTCRAS